ncbi:MAG: phosphodiester glycosidase family protein [Muribaculaceae bacterium]|nr:phosphodiester glycosidase family protein [Muribaculaceae bacterium]
MKKTILLSLALIAPFASWASKQWTLQGNTYKVDTLYHAPVGPGTTQTSLHVEGAYVLNIFYTTTDLTHPNVEMRVAPANKNSLAGGAAVSTMAKNNTTDEVQYFAGVNADFFGYSKPIGSTVINNEIWYANNNGWTGWAIDVDKKPLLGNSSFVGTVTSSNGVSHTLTSVNNARAENNLVIYTTKYGSTSGTNDYGTEVIITPVEGALSVGTVQMKVVETPHTKGSTSIPLGSYILSGHGTASTFVAGLTEGEVITVSTYMKLGDTQIIPTQMAGGQPMILSGGQVLSTESALDHLTALNPRTAIGYDATGSKLILLVVDGRSSASQGCVSKVLADIMREVGCSEAMNFDGGGSSALYTKVLGVRNSPSDGKERAVTNGVFAVSNAPVDNTVASLAFEDFKTALPKYGFYNPRVYAFNKYGVMISDDFEEATLSCPKELGEIVDDGKILFSNGSGSHLLTATYGNVKAEVIVTIGSGAPAFRLDSVLVDSYTDYTMEVTATVGDKEMPIENSALTWSIEDNSIATIDNAGEIHGVKNGTTRVYGSVEEFFDTILVKVEIPTVRYQDAETNINASTWKVSKSGVKNDALAALGSNGLAIDYTISSARSPYIKLTKTLPLWSRPDSIEFQINPGDASIKQITVQVTPSQGARAVNVTITPILVANAVNRVQIPVGDIAEVTDAGIYPLTINAITLYSGDAVNAVNHIEIPHIYGVYKAIAFGDGVGVEDIIADKANDALIIVPNPVEAGEIVTLNVAENTTYTLYNAAGALVAKGNGNQLATVQLTSGIYIVSVAEEGATRTARLVIK